jgi:hypothetical protein
MKTLLAIAIKTKSVFGISWKESRFTPYALTHHPLKENFGLRIDKLQNGRATRFYEGFFRTDNAAQSAIEASSS